MHAQRPVGDTIAIGTGDYLYDTIHLVGSYYVSVDKYSYFDPAYRFYLNDLYYRFIRFDPEINTWHAFFLAHPELFDNSPHIGGQQFYTSEGGKGDTVRVIGLAVCPIVNPKLPIIYDSWGLGTGNVPIIDTSMENRVTEYVQLYSVAGSTLRLRAEGPWRIEDPHRYLQFPSYCAAWFNSDRLNVTTIDSAFYAPLYEVMFDTAVLIDDGTFVVAGTHNNDSLRWCDTCSDNLILPELTLCYNHPPTCYTASWLDFTPPPTVYSPVLRPFWIKPDNDTMPWVAVRYYGIPDSLFGTTYSVYNIFPILDTLWGTPCAAVSTLRTVAVDTLWATVTWNTDARHHDWEVEYWPTGMPPDSATVVTDTVPMVTLTGLAPGTEYGVRVRGLCDESNYSPWSDTLLFTTPQDTTQDTLPHIIPYNPAGIDAAGSLDRFSQMMPNPAGEVVNVLSSYRLVSVAVYDLSGRRMLNQPAEGLSATLDVSALPRGTYIVAIRTLQGIATKKLMVER